MSAQSQEPLPPTEFDREVDRVAREILKVRRTAQKKIYWGRSSSDKNPYSGKGVLPNKLKK